MISESDLDRRLTDLRKPPHWAAGDHAVVLDEVLAAAPITRPADRTRRRRLAAITAATCLVVGSGVGVAAAAVIGYGPKPAGDDAFGFPYYSTDTHPHALPGTVRLILRAPGPHGETLRLRVADASKGDGYCSSLSTSRRRVSGVFGCRPAITSFGRTDQLVSISTPGPRGGFGITEFSVTVPDAATVEVAFSDGTSERLAEADQFAIGWLTDAQTLKHPELVGYAASGRLIGRTELFPAFAQKAFACYPHCRN